MTQKRWATCVVCFSIVLIVYGNVADVAVGADTLAISWAGGLKALGLLVIAAVAARACHLAWPEIGLRRTHVVRSTVIGLAVALALAAISLLVLRLGPFVGGRVTYAPLNGEAVPPLLFHALIALPLQTALPEELAFRGVLLGLLMRRLSPARAAVVMSAVFVAWHVVVQAQTLAQTNLNGFLLIVLAAVAAVLGIFVGGLLFALLRVRTGNLAGAIAAHWGFNAGLVLGLYVLTRT